jgi:capsid protein
MIHRFVTTETDQVRGIPWAQSALQPGADLRDYDNEVLDAARAAASMGVYWYTRHPDAPYFDVPSESDVERRQQVTGPPGWEPYMVDPKQPNTSYKEFTKAKRRDMGRVVSMPAMIIDNDSGDHNYSSARFDDGRYRDGVDVTRAWIARMTLNGLVDDVRRECELSAAANPRWELAGAFRKPPRRIELSWVWKERPHVDRAKEATGERIELENGTLTFAEACAQNGLDEDAAIASRARTIKKFEAAGVPLPSFLSGQGVKSGADLKAEQDAQAAHQQQDDQADEATAEESAADAKQE